MAYRDDINALSPDYLWRFDGGFTDDVAAAVATVTGVDSGSAICEDSTNSSRTNAVNDVINIPTGPQVAYDRKAVGGWFQTNSIQLPPKNLYREGGTGNQFNFVVWAGNNLMLDVVNGSTVVQAFADQVLSPGRNYHIFGRVEGTGFGNKCELYIDGVKQSITEPSPPVLGATELGARSNGRFGNVGTQEVGNASVALNAFTNGLYAFWAFFSGANAQLTDTQIREELFEKGALPGVTVANQTELDALADTVRPDEPLNIRVTGTTSLSLTADNIIHDPKASIHVQWMGTGTLTWTNTNGSNASIGSTPNGGTIDFVTPATLTASPLIENSEVRIYQAGTTTELAGIENSGTSFSQSINASSVDVVVHKKDYENIKIKSVDMTSGDVALPIAQQFDRNYENP